MSDKRKLPKSEQLAAVTTDVGLGLPDPNGPPQPVASNVSVFGTPARVLFAITVGGTLLGASGGCIIRAPGAIDPQRVPRTPSVEATGQSTQRPPGSVIAPRLQWTPRTNAAGNASQRDGNPSP